MLPPAGPPQPELAFVLPTNSQPLTTSGFVVIRTRLPSGERDTQADVMRALTTTTTAAILFISIFRT